MAIDLEDEYPGQVEPASAAYPFGKPKNQNDPGDNTGFPWEEKVPQELFGFLHAALTEAGIVPSGTPDAANASQYLTALKTILRTRLGDVSRVKQLSRASINPPGSTELLRLRFLPARGVWFALAEDGISYFSNDRVNWVVNTDVDTSAGGLADYNDVAERPSDGRIVTFGNGTDTSRLVYSDGDLPITSWTSPTTPPPATMVMHRVLWETINGQFIAVGDDGGTTKASVSADGVTWATNNLGITGGGELFVAFSGTRIVVTTLDGQGAYSTNGTSWTTFATPLPGGVRGIGYDATAQLFVMLGSRSTPDTRLVGATSPDGITWTSLALESGSGANYMSPMGTGGVSGVAVGNGLWVLGIPSVAKSGSPDGVQKLLASPDQGQNWYAAEYANPSTGQVRDITYGDGMFGLVRIGDVENVLFSAPDDTAPRLAWSQ